MNYKPPTAFTCEEQARGRSTGNTLQEILGPIQLQKISRQGETIGQVRIERLNRVVQRRGTPCEMRSQ